MKKLIAIGISIFYVIATAGIAVNAHYCHGHLVSVKIYSDKVNCCCDIQEKVSDCCTDESLYYKLDTEQQAGQEVKIIPDDSQCDILIPKHANLLNSDNFEVFSIEKEKPPPNNPPLWLFNCSLIFYG